MYYFSQFGAQGLSAWAARPNAPANALQQAGSRDATIDTVGNAAPPTDVALDLHSDLPQPEALQVEVRG